MIKFKIFAFLFDLKVLYIKIDVYYYFNKKLYMEIQVKIHVNAVEAQEITERLVKTNLEVKLNSYLKKYEDKEDAKWSITVKINKNKKDLFDWVLQAHLDRDDFRYERQDYKNLDDLINNLFEHFKLELSDK